METIQVRDFLPFLGDWILSMFKLLFGDIANARGVPMIVETVFTLCVIIWVFAMLFRFILPFRNDKM